MYPRNPSPPPSTPVGILLTVCPGTAAPSRSPLASFPRRDHEKSLDERRGPGLFERRFSPASSIFAPNGISVPFGLARHLRCPSSRLLKIVPLRGTNYRVLTCISSTQLHRRGAYPGTSRDSLLFLGSVSAPPRGTSPAARAACTPAETYLHSWKKIKISLGPLGVVPEMRNGDFISREKSGNLCQLSMPRMPSLGFLRAALRQSPRYPAEITCPGSIPSGDNGQVPDNSYLVHVYMYLVYVYIHISSS